MSSTQENMPQTVTKGASAKHLPIEHPADLPLTTEPTRKAHESKPAHAAGSPAVDPLATSHPLRWFFLFVLIAVGTTVGTAYYQNLHEVIDERHLGLQGNVDVRQVNMAFKVGGRIMELYVDEGDKIVAGQKLALLDDSYFRDDLRLAKAQRDNAKAALEKLRNGSRSEEIAGARALVAERKATLRRAEHDFERFSKLIKVHAGAVSKLELDSVEGALQEAVAKLDFAQKELEMVETGPRSEDISAAEAQLEAQEASIGQVERRLEDSVLIAPSDGMVLTRAREKGAIVNPGETILALTLTSPVWVRTYVNEIDLGRIEPGMTAEVKTDSKRDKVYQGHVGFISPAAEFTPKTVETRELRTDLVYRLRVIVDDPDGGLRQGMPVTVTIDVGQKD